MTRFVTVTAVVVGYVAVLLALSAATTQRETRAFHDAPVQLAAFHQALDRGDATQAREVHAWLAEHAPTSPNASTSTCPSPRT